MIQQDRETVKGWVKEYTPRLLDVARSFAEGPTEPEDILQETWITALHKCGQRKTDDAVGAWLTAITLNIGKSLVRKRQRRMTLTALWSDAASRGWRGVGAPELDEELSSRALWRAIAELPQLQKDVLLLRVVDDMSTKQTADHLDRAEGTIKVSLHRALKSLRGRLGEVEAFMGHVNTGDRRVM